MLLVWVVGGRGGREDSGQSILTPLPSPEGDLITASDLARDSDFAMTIDDVVDTSIGSKFVLFVSEKECIFFTTKVCPDWPVPFVRNWSTDFAWVDMDNKK